MRDMSRSSEHGNGNSAAVRVRALLGVRRGLQLFGAKGLCSMYHTELPPGPEKPLGNYFRLYWAI